jgi:hypothetical protein
MVLSRNSDVMKLHSTKRMRKYGMTNIILNGKKMDKEA